jgi:beta-hydroxylase
MATIGAPITTEETAAKASHSQWLGCNVIKRLAALQYLWFVTITLGLKAINLTVPRRFSLVETTPFIDPTQFEWHQHVTAEMPKVQAELKTLLSVPEKIPNHQDIIETIASISNDGQMA